MLDWLREKLEDRRRRREAVDWRIRWFKRIGIGIGTVTLVAWLGAWFVLTGTHIKTADWIDKQTLQTTASMGFRVRNILVEGRTNSDPDVIMALLNVGENDPIFSFNPNDAKDLMMRIQWVRAAHVERRLPDTVYVRLEERTPIALYKTGKKIILIDDLGHDINVTSIKKFSHLPMVSGDGAPEHTPELLQMLNAEPDVFAKVDSAARIENRRWNLLLTSGKVIKLPAEDIGLALAALADAQRQDQILDMDFMYIDVRDASKMVIKPRLGKAKNYKTGYEADNLETSL